MSIRQLFSIVMLSVFVGVTAVRAQPEVGSGGQMPLTLLCFHAYLPIVTGGGGEAAAQPNGGIILPPGGGNNGNHCQTFADFNGDGYDDLAVGVLMEDLNGVDNTGAVNVINGNGGGLWTANDQFWHRDVPDVLAANATNDHFSESMAFGDFNGDGYTDLAVGTPDAERQGVTNAGTVHAFYGSMVGLTAVNNQMWSQAGDIQGILEENDQFGQSLAVGDFNNDGYDDLAVGVPYEDVNTIEDAGAVNIIFGSVDGLTTTGNQIWVEDDLGLFGVSQEDDLFGFALTAADFDGDGYDDLAVGVPNQDLGQGVAIADAGVVFVLPGSAEGPSTTGLQLWSQGGNVQGVVEAFDRFGQTLAAADFNADGYADLAVGLPGEDVDDQTNAGAVNVLYGTANGLWATNNQIWHQDSVGFVGNLAEADDHFGYSLTTGDYNGDGYADLAVGAPFEEVGGVPPGTGVQSAGSVEVLFGTPLGLSAADYQFLSQINSAIEGTAEPFDLFGWAVTSGDYNGDGYADLAIGVPQDDGDGVANAGAVNVLYGWAQGISVDDDDLWSQFPPGIMDTAEVGDLFGATLP